MFYSVDLLTLKRNGKFTKCWLAANLSPKVFYNKFRRQTISSVSIAETCKELILHVTAHSSNHRFSLYLSSQLMFGVTRIFHYQTDTLLKHHWELWINTNAARISNVVDGVRKTKRNKQPDSPVDQTQLLSEKVPTALHTMVNMVKCEDQITLCEDDIFVNGNDVMMRNAELLEFGVLTSAQMDQILEHGGLLFDSSQPTQVRAIPEKKSDDTLFTLEIPDHSIQRVTLQNGTLDLDHISEADSTFNEIPLPKVAEESASTRVFQPRAEWTGTPTKRKLPYMPKTATPLKKRRDLETENGDATVPEPIRIPTESARVVVRTSSTHVSLDSLNSSVFQLRSTTKKKRKLKIDRYIELVWTDRVLETGIPKTVIQIARKPAAELLTTPSTQPAWSKTLLANYKMMILKPISKSPVDNIIQCFPSLEEPTLPRAGSPSEVVRAPDLFTAEPSAELSKDLLVKTTTSEDISKFDQTKPLDQDSIAQVALPPLAEELCGKTDSSGQVEMPPKLSESVQQRTFRPSYFPKVVREVMSDWMENGQPHSSRFSSACRSIEKIVICPTSEASGSQGTQTSRSEITWVKADILGMLEILWLQKRTVKFSCLFDSVRRTRKDIARGFTLLLELHASKAVKLRQAKVPYSAIFIEKNTDFSGLDS